jgi:UDP-N-acetylmuramate dehydrogenase
VSALQNLHTFGLAYNALHTVEILCLEDVSKILNCTQRYVILGEGSNTIFTTDYAGTVFVNRLKGIALQQTQDAYYLNVASGENWHELIKWCLDRDIGGFENLALIPGTVGAAPIQNIGAYGVEISQFIYSVSYIDLRTGKELCLNHDELKLGYRDSIFKHNLKGSFFITNVVFVLPKVYELELSYGELAQLSEPTKHSVFDKVVEIRSEKLPDPKQVGNAGSFFKNPVVTRQVLEQIQKIHPDVPHYVFNDNTVKIPAAWLIEKAGFKGRLLGGVQCHPKQALVLTNANQAKGIEVLSFARIIQKKIAKLFDIYLENEVCLLGKNDITDLNGFEPFENLSLK